MVDYGELVSIAWEIFTETMVIPIHRLTLHPRQLSVVCKNLQRTKIYPIRDLCSEKKRCISFKILPAPEIIQPLF